MGKRKQFAAALCGLYSVLALLCVALYQSKRYQGPPPREPEPEVSAKSPPAVSIDPAPVPKGIATIPLTPAPKEPPAITSWIQLRSRAEAEVVTVRGRSGLPNRGIAQFLSFPGVPEFEDVSPQFDLKLSDGTVITCSYKAMRADRYSDWAAKHPIGGEATLRGVYWPAPASQPQLLTHCEDVAPESR